MEVDQDKVVDSTGALAFKSLPKSMAIVGGGYIGLELGMAYAKFGTKVTIVEFMDSVLASFDKDVIQLIQKKLKKLGVETLTNSKAQGTKKSGKQVVLGVETPEGLKELKVDHVAVCVGRRPNTASLNLAKAGLEPEKSGFIKVNDKLQTRTAGIYAIGDVAGQPMLAQSFQGSGNSS